jgi:hypothetical protein
VGDIEARSIAVGELVEQGSGKEFPVQERLSATSEKRVVCEVVEGSRI